MKTAIIMSEEEAMALPKKDRPICFRISSEMYHGVFESVGASSMTFNKDTGNEVFNSEQASKIAVELCFKIANEIEAATEGLEKITEAGWRLANYSYSPWSGAGGEKNCKHGIAEGIFCERCDRELLLDWKNKVATGNERA